MFLLNESMYYHTIRNVMGAILLSRTSQWWSTFCYSQAHNLDWIWVVCIRGIHYVCQMCCSKVNIAKNILSWVANQSAPSTLSTFLLHTNRCSWQASYFRRHFVITRNTRTAQNAKRIIIIIIQLSFNVHLPYMVSWTTLSCRVLSTRSSSAATTLLLLLSLLSFTHYLKLSSTITLSALTLCCTFLALASLWNPSPYSLLFTSPQTSPLYAAFECAFFSDSSTQNVMSRQCSLAEFIRQTLLFTNLLIHSGSVSKFNGLVLTWS